MRSLDIAREVCEEYHPGLCKSLGEVPLLEAEKAGSPIIELFRSHGGPGLLVPAGYAGSDADPLEAVRTVRALSSYAPSLGAAVTMHHFTVAMLFALTGVAGRLSAEQTALLSRIAGDRLLIASGWAEGRPNQNILVPAVTAEPVDGGYRINGGKKPCSLSRSMDLLTASVAVPDENGVPGLAVLLVPADSPGVSVHPFWDSFVLAGAESEEIRLHDVYVPEKFVIRAVPEDPTRIDDLQTAGFVWFEMLITSVYVGAVSALVERALIGGRGSVTDRAAMISHLETAVALTEGVARGIQQDLAGDDAVAAVLHARYTAQRELTAAADLAAELLGGIAYVTSSEIAYLIAAARPLAFHPPSRSSTAEALVEFAAGRPLVLS